MSEQVLTSLCECGASLGPIGTVTLEPRGRMCEVCTTMLAEQDMARERHHSKPKRKAQRRQGKGVRKHTPKHK